MHPDLPELAPRLRALTARRAGLAVGLWGEPGIGKTYTVRALLREVPCRSLSLQAAASPADLARSLPRPARLPPWAGRLLERVGRGEVPEGTGTVDALGAALAALAPFVLHLEDLHEAGAEDQHRVAALAALVRRTRGVGLLITSRAPPPQEFEALRLLPLGRAQSDALLEAGAGAPLPREALSWLFDHAAGNPLFTLEYFRLLARQGHLWNDGQHWHWRPPSGDPMPVVVEALIERVLLEAGRSGELRGVIGAQALLPVDVDPALLAQVSGLAPAALGEAQRELERRGVLTRGRFAHPLYREVGLRTLGPDQRRKLARRALDALAHDPARAADFVDSAQLAPLEARTLLEQAAAAATGAGRTAQAARFWARAADCAEGDDRAGLALRAARALETIDPSEALRLARVASELRPGDPEAALYLAGRLVQRSHRLSDADEVLGQLSPEVHDGPAWVAWQIAFLAGSGRYPQALEVWEAHPALHDDPNPATLYSVAVCLAQTGQFAPAAALARRGLALPGTTPTQRASLLNVSSMVCAFLGEPEAAEAHLVSALALAREHGLAQMRGALLQNRAKNLERTERFADALAAAQEASQAYAEAGDTLRYANAGVLVAGHLAEFGRYEEAETALLDSLALLERQGPSRFLVVAQITLVGLYLDWQPPHGAVLALKLARSALDHARSLGPAPNILAFALAALARAAAGSGDPHSALAHAQEAVGLAQQADESPFLTLAALAAAHAALGQPEQARSALAGAIEAAEARGFVLDARRLMLEAARLANDQQAAREQAAWFAARGLLGGVHLAERSFPEPRRSEPGGEAPATPGGPASPPDLRLEVLGPLRCGVPGQLEPVRGQRRRALLACLLEARLRGRGEASRLELLEALYPQTEEAQAAAALKELVHQTRAALGAGVVRTTAGGYALGVLTTDAETFLATGDTALWRGPYLAGEEAPPDSLIAETLYAALTARAQALGADQPAEAARVGRLLCAADPYDLAALALTLRALRAAGNHRSLTRFYATARRELLEVGESMPEEWTTFLQAHAPA